jgi:hypothetical protein
MKDGGFTNDGLEQLHRRRTRPKRVANIFFEHPAHRNAKARRTLRPPGVRHSTRGVDETLDKFSHLARAAAFEPVRLFERDGTLARHMAGVNS